MQAASAINACRVHAGYHYPRSPETIEEVKEANSEFLKEFAPAIVRNSCNYYAIPKVGSRTSAEAYERLMQQHGLAVRACRPDWLNFEFIEACYQVDEHLYNPNVLRRLIEDRVQSLGIAFEKRAFTSTMRAGYDFAVWATYGQDASRCLLGSVKVQVAEKILIELPAALRNLAVVIIDGPFTAFDSYADSGFSLFGSAKYTNHWSTTDPSVPIPEQFRDVLHRPQFEPVAFTHFEEMRADCSEAIPAAEDAIYKGSRFAIRVVENNPDQDRRTLHIVRGEPGEFHIFSGKVVSAVKAARLICEAIAQDG